MIKLKNVLNSRELWLPFGRGRFVFSFIIYKQRKMYV